MWALGGFVDTVGTAVIVVPVVDTHFTYIQLVPVVEIEIAWPTMPNSAGVSFVVVVALAYTQRTLALLSTCEST